MSLLQSDRLTPLCDGRPGLRSTLHIEVHTPPVPSSSPVPPLHPMERGPGGEAPTSPPADSSPSPPQEERAGERRPPPTEIRDNSCNSCNGPCLDFTSSDDTLDRYQEIITPAGWQLDNYRRNPVFQNSHQYGDIIFTLGRALITEIRSGPSTINSQPSTHLFQRIQFATDVNPMARIAYGLYSAKFLNAVSVGFVPLRWEDSDGTEHRSLSSSGGEGRGEEVRSPLRTPHSALRTYLEQELLEVSAVAIPANPNALALAYKSGAVQKTDLRETLDLLRSLCPSDPASSILPLARQLRDLLRHT